MKGPFARLGKEIVSFTLREHRLVVTKCFEEIKERKGRKEMEHEKRKESGKDKEKIEKT